MYCVQTIPLVYGTAHSLQVNQCAELLGVSGFEYIMFIKLMKLFKGWSREESEILRKALIKFGIGNWAKIIESQCLPGKTNAQMNLQLQRMLGQQSTAGMSIHIIYLIPVRAVCHAIYNERCLFLNRI